MTTVDHRAPEVGTGEDGRPTRWRVPVGVVLVVGFLISVVSVGRASLSLDESVSTWLAWSPWHVFTRTVLHREPNMSLYYLSLRGWKAVATTVFGHGVGAETIVRTFSVAASVGALAVIMVVTRRLFDRRTALVCGMLLAVDPLVVMFAQDARGYALSLLLVSASSALFVRGIRQPSGWGLWLGYAVVSALAAYTNFWAALVPLAHGASIAFLPRRMPRGVGWCRPPSVSASCSSPWRC